MNIVELFAGTKSLSKAASTHMTFTSDIDPVFNTDYTVDIHDFDINKVPFKVDFIWASPPCESFSVASIGHHWNTDNTPKTQEAIDGVNRVLKTFEIIEKLQPKAWIIENPRGKLRKLDLMNRGGFTDTQLPIASMEIQE